MFAVDAVTRQVYLQLHPKLKVEDIPTYFSDLCPDSLQDNCTKIDIVLDNSSTHQEKS
jgi:hypothetical protein